MGILKAMTKKLRWAAVAAVLVLGILSQMPARDHAAMPGHAHPDDAGATATPIDAFRGTPPASADRALPGARMRMLLTVSGMT